MFRYEHLSERWIASCAAYLRSLFGDSLYGKTVVDYAFGRGNWSLAFLLAGAGNVIAIDASTDLVARFQEYCRAKGIDNIEVLAGNIFVNDINARGDLVWLYGILPNVEDHEAFLNRIKTLAAGPQAQIYIYQFNAGSLREFTVQTCRNVIVYQTETEFRDDSYLFVRPARMRARDDLTAPYVNFSTASELQEQLRSCGIYVEREDEDFQQFLLGKATEDFYPHQFLCGLQPDNEIEVRETSPPYAEEVRVLKMIARDVFSVPLTAGDRKNIAIGLYNTHFAFLRDGVQAYDAVIEVFLFMLYVLLQNGVQDSALSSSVVTYYRLFRAVLAGEDRSQRLQLIPADADNKLTHYLVNNNPRS